MDRRLALLASLILVHACGGTVAHEKEDAPGAAGSPTNIPAGSGAGPGVETIPGAPRGFVALAYGGTVLVSDDGTRWESRSMGFAHHGHRIASARGHVVALGDRNAVAVTEDLRTWREIEVGSEDCGLYDVAFVSGHFVAVGGGWREGACAFTSEDGATWTAIAGAPENYMFRSLVRESDATIVGASLRSDLTAPAIFVHEPGGFRRTAFADPQREVPHRPAFYDAVALGDRIALVDGKDAVLVWSDTSVFGPVADGPPIEDASWQRIVRGGGKLVVLGTLDGRTAAPEGALGVRDESSGSPVTITRRAPSEFRAGAHDGSRFAVVTKEAEVLTSKDGSVWNVVVPAGALGGAPLVDVAVVRGAR